MKILSAKQLAAADKATTVNQQITSIQLMERVATLVFERIHKRLNGAPIPVKIFCGIGNNGGDGLAIARHMIQHGYHVTIYVTNCSKKRTSAFLHNYEQIKEVTKDWPVLLSCEDDFPEITEKDFVIDSIFGTGLNRPITGWMAQLILKINESNAFVVSVDMPSGLFADKAHAKKPAIIKANHTFTFQTPKLSFYFPETASYVGSYDVINIGLDPTYMIAAKPMAQVITPDAAQRIYRPREPFSHKGTFGHVLVFAGSKGKMGAAILACQGALNSGSGKVTAYIPEHGNAFMQTTIPEVMTQCSIGTSHITDFDSDLKNAVLCLGPGIGLSDDTVSAFAKALQESSKPIVIDADGLNILAKQPELWLHVPENTVITPHDVEFERLVGSWKNSFERLELAKKLSKERHVIVILKGFHTAIILDDDVYFNDTGNPGMATAGSGDVLAGVIAGFIAQGYDPLTAGIFSTFIHGLAGDLVAQTYAHEGVKASLIASFIGPAVLTLFKKSDNSEK